MALNSKLQLQGMVSTAGLRERFAKRAEHAANAAQAADFYVGDVVVGNAILMILWRWWRSTFGGGIVSREMLLLMLSLQLRIGGLCHICNDWALLRCVGRKRLRHASALPQNTTGGGVMGYHLEEHFVTDSQGWH